MPQTYQVARRRVLAVVVERANVAAGAERLVAGAREHDGVHGLVRLDLVEALREVVHHWQVERVEHLGAVELDRAHAHVLAVRNVGKVVLRLDRKAARRRRSRDRLAHRALEETHARRQHALHHRSLSLCICLRRGACAPAPAPSVVVDGSSSRVCGHKISRYREPVVTHKHYSVSLVFSISLKCAILSFKYAEMKVDVSDKFACCASYNVQYTTDSHHGGR